jgi:hypothetical protein
MPRCLGVTTFVVTAATSFVKNKGLCGLAGEKKM